MWTLYITASQMHRFVSVQADMLGWGMQLKLLDVRRVVLLHQRVPRPVL